MKRRKNQEHNLGHAIYNNLINSLIQKGRIMTIKYINKEVYLYHCEFYANLTKEEANRIWQAIQEAAPQGVNILGTIHQVTEDEPLGQLFKDLGSVK
jgi:hypothetical protein